MRLDDLKVYNLSMEIGEQIWEYIEKWEHLDKSTIGMQLIRAVDSIAANISERYGRFHHKENKQFLYYARGH